MITTAKISCRVAAEEPGLNLAIKVDDQIKWQGDPYGQHDIAFEIPDDEAEHVLTFDLSGKTADHTKVDQDGNITQDLTVSVSELAFDDLALGMIMVNHAIYSHDFNGSGQLTQEKFYGTMGCNGTVSLRFTTPIYVWLLENM